MEMKNRPEMQAANQYREKSDFKPASEKTPAIGSCVKTGICSSYPTISLMTYEYFKGMSISLSLCWLEIVENFSLPYSENACYLLSVAAKSVTGRRNPCMLLATPDALINRVFFCVDATAHPFTTALIRTVSMVALVGQLSGWPVSSNAGIPTPASVTAPIERRNSGGDSFKLLLEFIAMMTIPTQNHPKFRFRFLALCATESAIIHITATHERKAKLTELAQRWLAKRVGGAA